MNINKLLTKLSHSSPSSLKHNILIIIYHLSFCLAIFLSWTLICCPLLSEFLGFRNYFYILMFLSIKISHHSLSVISILSLISIVYVFLEIYIMSIILISSILSVLLDVKNDKLDYLLILKLFWY